MPNKDTPSSDVHAFVQRWEISGAAERANYQIFLTELCDVLGVARPEPTKQDEEENAYVFEKAVTFNHADGSTSHGRIDLYKRGCFVLEAKQGSDREKKVSPVAVAAKKKKGRKGTAIRGTKGWDDAMVAARGQAEQYARALPASEGRPPFLIVVDVGHSIELYSEFTRTGGNYIPYPDPRSHRVLIRDLEKEGVRETLRSVWVDPMSLDPSRRSAKITQEIAVHLAALAKSLEASGHSSERASAFLMRAIFTMFAEDVKLIPERSFAEMLEGMRGNVSVFPDMVRALWSDMAVGGFSPVLRQKLLRFNGGLFESAEALPVTEEQLELLIEASKADWRDVEPAIFGTLLERALDPRERHKLGAHYTPRAYVERLVLPTVIEPLRDEWRFVQAAAVTLAKGGNLDGAVAEVRSFHEKLCQTRVLDPACGSGNFLYVTLEHMKRLEGEVLDALESFGYRQSLLLTVDPHQLLGLENNSWAAAIADLVLWIGYLQWHFRTRGEAMPREPVLRKFDNILSGDAVLAYDDVVPATDESGRPITRWDGRTFKKHPVTGRDVPDEAAQAPYLLYINAREKEWPETDFVVGNPPFIGTRRMRLTLNDGYVDALARVMPDVPENADYVMYWWDKAARLVRSGKLRGFGLITTNSITQTFNRAVLHRHLTAKDRMSIVFAIPDHPWVDSSDGAAVRVAMTVGAPGEVEGRRHTVVKEMPTGDIEIDVELSPPARGMIMEDLRVGVSTGAALPLAANSRVAYWGVKFYGDGFIVTPAEAASIAAQQGGKSVARPFVSGRDLTGKRRGLMAFDCDGLELSDLRRDYPETYQHLLDRVKPVREHNPRAFKRERWWIFGENQPGMRKAVEGLGRYIATTETAKHRFFEFLDGDLLAEGTVAAIALEDAFYLGVLSSRIHVVWALAAGGRLGIGNDPRYNKTRCFEPFPFPDCIEEQKERIREHAEELDAHRKRQRQKNPDLTMTDVYNVLGKLRAGEELTKKDLEVHGWGLVTVLRQIHDDLDAAVYDAYGWPATLTDDEIIERVVALNMARTAEERGGAIKWLRPDFQNPAGASQGVFDTGDEEMTVAAAPKAVKEPWPTGLAEQVKAVRRSLAAQHRAVTPEQLAKSFSRARVDRIAELLETLAAMGQVREVDGGCFIL
jgi:SAM-dependent methyltransferase